MRDFARDFYVLTAPTADFPAGAGETVSMIQVPGDSDFELQQLRVEALLYPPPWSPTNLWITNLPLETELTDNASMRTFLPWVGTGLIHLGPMVEPRRLLTRSYLQVRLRKAPDTPPLYRVSVALFGRKVFSI